jgi:hypothetical protein
MLGQLYYCLQQNRVYDGSIAFGEPVTSAVPSAA